MKESETTMTTTNKLQQIATGNTTTAAPKAATTAGNPAPKTAAPTGHNETASVKGQILSIVQSLQMIDEERIMMGETLDKLFKEHGIDKKVARKVARIIHKKNKAEYEAEQDSISRLYDRIS